MFNVCQHLLLLSYPITERNILDNQGWFTVLNCEFHLLTTPYFVNLAQLLSMLVDVLVF